MLHRRCSHERYANAPRLYESQFHCRRWFRLGTTLNRLAEGVSLVGSAELNAYVQVRGDGKIIIFSGSPEMGQGIKTSLPMIVAEEMGANWDDVIVKQTPEIDTERYGQQWTGGSFTLYLNWNLMR